MINHPITFHRNFQFDLSFKQKLSENEPELGELSESTWAFPSFEEVVEKGKRVAVATLPVIAAYCHSARGPLSCVMSCIRVISHADLVWTYGKNREFHLAAFHAMHVALAVCALVLFFFNPVLCFLCSSISDLILNLNDLVQYALEKDVQGALQSLAFIVLDLLFLTSFMFGTIEMVVACLILQTILALYICIKAALNGEYLESLCSLALAGAHVQQLVPQTKLLHWKNTRHPVCTAEIKQDARGFVYLDIPDEYLGELLAMTGDPKAELPPYFGKDRAGAHISVIAADEGGRPLTLRPQDVGKKVSFQIVHVDAVKPDGWKGMKKVHFVTVRSPELQDFRTQYGLSPKLDGHDFHITFGVERALA